MRCNNCGTEIPDGYAACPSCGAKATYDQSQAQGQGQGQPFGAPNYQNQGYNQGYQQGYGPGGYNQGGYGVPPVSPNAPEFVTYLVIGIVSTLCCCNFLIGIPGIILSILMNSAFKSRDLAGYNSFRTATKWVYIIGVALWVLGFVFSIFSGFLSTVLGHF